VKLDLRLAPGTAGILPSLKPTQGQRRLRGRSGGNSRPPGGRRQSRLQEKRATATRYVVRTYSQMAGRRLLAVMMAIHGDMFLSKGINDSSVRGSMPVAAQQRVHATHTRATPASLNHARHLCGNEQLRCSTKPPLKLHPSSDVLFITSTDSRQKWGEEIGEYMKLPLLLPVETTAAANAISQSSGHRSDQYKLTE
jgi:hypothetical protein